MICQIRQSIPVTKVHNVSIPSRLSSFWTNPAPNATKSDFHLFRANYKGGTRPMPATLLYENFGHRSDRFLERLRGGEMSDARGR